MCPTDSIYIMSSPGQRRGSCGHAMANFDTHQYCARCREKDKGSDPCIKEPQSDNCHICNAFSEDQRQQLATPYRLKKEKREAKKLVTAPPQESEELLDPANVAVIGAVDKKTEKKTKKDLKKDIRKEKSPLLKLPNLPVRPVQTLKLQTWTLSGRNVLTA